ncbi:MAG: phosphoribosyltransferase domain-containing protein [Clostridia bacterium]|nr:phosphoribosyltransferase domain-containing protein [Clostridia bacterium]
MNELLKYIKIKNNELKFKLSDIIQIAATPKKERVFYLLNKLVGNHLEVKPNKIKAVGHILASLVYKGKIDTNILSEYIKENLNNDDVIEKELSKYIEPQEKVFVLGLAKSATAIGMATAEAIKDSYYLSTVRETPMNMKYLFDFEENHTLLTTHRCYLKEVSELEEANHIIIVEDEITTGNTIINLIDKISQFSNAKKISIVTILNFSNKHFTKKLMKIGDKLNIQIKVHEILKGKLRYEKLNKKTVELAENNINNIDVIKETTSIKNINKYNKIIIKTNNIEHEMMEKSGCFGVSFNEIQEIEVKAKEIAEIINSNHKKVLVISYGENMYVPSRIAYYINKNADFKCITRNRILAKNKQYYPIEQCTAFNIDGIEYYLYNKNKIEKEYEKVYFIVDRDINVKLTNNTEIIKI